MRRILLAFTLTILVSCSDPQGWTLWGHAYSVEDDENKLIGDDWESYDTYSSAGDCKSQMKSDLTSLEKNLADGAKDADYKVTLQRETSGLKATSVPLPGAKEKREKLGLSEFKSRVVTYRFFCLPLGMDPRQKDPLTWTLWERKFVKRNGRTESTSWTPVSFPFKNSFLNERSCRLELESNQRGARPYNEKARKDPSGISAYYECFPSTVVPWGKQE